jgi:hypothetical protein
MVLDHEVTISGSRYMGDSREWIYVEPPDQAVYNALTQDEKHALKYQRKKDGKAMFYIHQFMHESIIPRVSLTNQDKKAWDIIKNSYQGMDKVKTSKLQILRRDFETLSMKETYSVDSFYTRVIGLIK